MSSDSSNVSPNIVFAGTPDFAALVLASILAEGHNISAVYCQPDRRVGRGKKLAAGSVKKLAIEQGIPVEQPVRFNQELDGQSLTATEKLASYQPDLMIVVAYGLILPQDVLKVAKYGCVNIHASLLPKWRGAAPIQRAIEHGDSQTGITIMQMDKGLDTGNMLLKKTCEITPLDTGSSLHDRLAELGSQAINEFLSSFSNNNGSTFTPGEIQDEKLATYAHKLSKSEAEIDWSESVEVIERKVRAFNAWPVSFTYAGKNRLRIWQVEISEQRSAPDLGEYQAGQIISFDKNGILVQCGDGQSLVIKELQADGSRAMSVSEMLNSKSQWFSEHPILGRIDLDNLDLGSSDLGHSD